jgi:RND family efflux transporter MFP subunit
MTTVVVLLAAMVQTSVAIEPIDGFVTPFRSIDVATAETGIVREIEVREGELVEPGQVLARLDDEVHCSLLAIAEKSMESDGRLKAAQAESRLREQRLSKLQELVGRGSARREEVDRAKTDTDIAAAQLRAIEEELAIRRLDHERARIQLERRSVRAPMRGVVLRLHKEVGEFTGPNDPHLMTIVQLDPLLAVFAVPSREARHLRIGQPAQVRLPETGAVVGGTVESVSPVVDGKSGTMRVEVRLDNPQRRFYSGEPCSLLLDHDPDDSDVSGTSEPTALPNASSPSSDQTAARDQWIQDESRKKGGLAPSGIDQIAQK